MTTHGKGKARKMRQRVAVRKQGQGPMVAATMRGQGPEHERRMGHPITNEDILLSNARRAGTTCTNGSE